MQTVMIRGAGLIGALVAEKLLRRNIPVVIVSRTPQRFAPQVGLQVLDRQDGAAQIGVLKTAQCVINLEGKNISGLWTSAAKKDILSSRLNSVAHLADLVKAAKNSSLQILQASATGYYGDRAAEILTESSDPGSGFLADTCVSWENAALKHFPRERFAIVRIAPVLSNSAGVFAVWRRVFRAHLGGRFGRGEQYFSWIHEHDMAELLCYYVQHFKHGVINAVAPEPVTNDSLTDVLGQVFNRKPFVNLPRFLVERIPGGFGREMLMASVRAIPKRVLADGFEFSFESFASAVADLA